MRAMTRRETCHPVREKDKGRREKKSRRSTLTGFACQHSNSAEFFSTHAAMLCPCCRGINAQKRSILHCCPLDCINVRCCAYMPSLFNHSSCEPAIHFWTRALSLPQPSRVWYGEVWPAVAAFRRDREATERRATFFAHTTSYVHTARSRTYCTPPHSLASHVRVPLSLLI